MFKHLLVIALAGTLAAAFDTAAWMPETPETSKTYPGIVQVYEIDGENDIVTFEDTKGFLWEITGIDDWQIGDFAAVIFDDAGTENNIFDDAIIEAKYQNIENLEGRF